MAGSGGMDLLAELTPAQQEAVTHFEGPLLIMAGAGSGKTRVITRRVAYLMEQGVRPHHILAITFTNKAANEMRQRVEAICPDNKVWVCTFHSLGVRLLRWHGERLGLDRNFTIYDQTDRNRLVKSALDAANLDHSKFTPDRIESAISRAKNQLLGPDRYAATANDFFTLTVAKVYPIYEKKLRDANAVDFDDLLLWPALAMKHDPELRAELDARFRFVLIDEYQDTNMAQYALAKGLSQDQPNLCVVGDPDQSIYKWRGSDIRNILDFERDFPDARVIKLERNYRSTKAILHAASHLIAFNKQRKPKALLTENPQGQPVTVLTFENGLDEADGIVERIRRGVDECNRKYGDHAIFLRINALSRALESAFLRQRVPYQIVRGLAFFDRKENRDVLAYLRLILNPRDDLAFERIVNEPARGVGKTSLQHLKNHAEPRGISLMAAINELERIPAIKGKAAKGLFDFRQLMAELSQMREAAPADVIRAVLAKSGYREMLDVTDTEDQERLANIEEVITAASQFSAEDSSRTLADFLENITLASDVDSWDDRQDCVSIMTLHSSKGLEFPVVFMAAVEQGLLPHERSLVSDEEIEEERRLAFVGMTRAKEELYLCHARLREFRGRTLYSVGSMFLDELPEEGVEQIDLSSSSAGSTRAMEAWRRRGDDGPRSGWSDSGFVSTAALERAAKPAAAGTAVATDYREGMIVNHESYGKGEIAEVTGHGILRKIKIRFAKAGLRTFIADKAKLEIVGYDG